ncbi:MAG: septal ring lytic transglycosylase RlpA family protein [Desulfovermiculus sp.]|nr:septal ring lytic transglycosylase RlpA family protein [Desulfovermiculus sp.]
MHHILLALLFLGLTGFVSSCSLIKFPYTVTKASLKTAYTVTKVTGKTAWGTVKVLTKVGGYTFEIATAPLWWPLTHEEIDSISGMPPKEAIAQGKVKNSPYVVAGRRYVPMSVAQSRSYQEKGMASWYGDETRNQAGGHMTANGETFDPRQLTAAHKHLPLPTYVRVTNLNNKRSIIVRVNDRGPFVSGRIIDLSAGAAKCLGFYHQGTTRVLVETVVTSEG